MKANMTMSAEQIKLLHHLPMSSLETQLKRCKLLNPPYHNRVLTPNEMVEYITWMSDNFGGREDFKFSTDDLSMIMGGNIAKAGFEMMKNTQRDQALKQISDIYNRPTEVQYFSENQSVSSSRFLRHFPLYWQTSDCFEILYVFSGECPVCFEDEQITLTPGSVLLIPPNIPRACNCPNDDCVMFFYMIRSSTFSRIFWDQLSNQSLMSLFFKQALGGKNSTTYLRFETNQDMAIESLLYSIYQQYTADISYSAQMTNSLMGTFFLYLLQNYEHTALVSKKSKFHWKPEFAEIFAYIQEHYQSVTMEELSNVFNYSQRQIIRIIQNSTAKTFSQLLTQLRMEKAATMILAKDNPLEQIATEVGYSSLSSFYRVFVNYYSMTPGEWRQQQHMK